MGGKSISGNATADGKNGWTDRLMWGQQGRGLAYVYYPEMCDHQYNKQACPRTGVGSGDCKIDRNKYFSYAVGNNAQCISEWLQGKDQFKFEAEHFYTIKQQIKMNRVDIQGQSNVVGKRDGILKIWLDNKLVFNCNNIRYRDVLELAIDGLLFNTFFGGNTVEISTHPRHEKIYFDDVLITY